MKIVKLQGTENSFWKNYKVLKIVLSVTINHVHFGISCWHQTKENRKFEIYCIKFVFLVNKEYLLTYRFSIASSPGGLVLWDVVQVRQKEEVRKLIELGHASLKIRND